MSRSTYVSVVYNISEYDVLWEKTRSLQSPYDTIA